MSDETLTSWADGLSSRQIVEDALSDHPRPLSIHLLQEALMDVLGRPVFTHELCRRHELLKELRGQRPSPDFDEIVDIIPESKRLVLDLVAEEKS